MVELPFPARINHEASLAGYEAISSAWYIKKQMLHI
jgi:hypothetical protein